MIYFLKHLNYKLNVSDKYSRAIYFPSAHYLGVTVKTDHRPVGQIVLFDFLSGPDEGR